MRRGRAAQVLNIAAFAFIFVVMATALFAQSIRVSNITVDGNRRIETATIQSYTGLVPGQTVTQSELNAAVQAIRATGLFESVSATPRGNTLAITVVEFPTVNRIAFEGNNRLGDEDLQRIVRSQPRRVYNPAIAEQDADTIAQVYADQGRLAATVVPKIIRRSDNRVDLIYEITEGGLVEIERISFVGNKAFSDRRLRGVLQTKQAGILRVLVARDTFVEDRIEFDQQVLRDFYNSRGYIDFRTVSVNSELSRERDGFFLTFNVQEGQQFRVGAVTTSTTQSDIDPDTFQNALKLREGAVYSPVAIENNIARLERLALNMGLNFIQVNPRISRNDRDLTLDVDFEINRGPRIFVERIDIEGNTTTLDRVVRRQFDIVEGDPFNPREIRRSASRIRALGYFSNADVNAREGSSPDQVVVDVDVTEQPTGSFSFGGNYSSQNGFGLLASFSERNFLGRGQRLSFDLATGRDTNQFSFDFLEPGLFDRDLAAGLSVSYRTTNNASALFDTTSLSITPSLAFPVSPNGRLTLNAFARSDDLFDVNTSTAIIQAEGERGRTSTGGLGYAYSFDNRRSGLNPNAGVVFRFSQDYAFAGDDMRYIETRALAAAETRVLGEDVTLRATLEAGNLHFLEGSSRVTDRYFPSSRQFRGFDRRGFGPREINGTDNDSLGGEMFAIARLEAEFPLGLPEEYGITGGVFLDHGSVWDAGDVSAADPGDLFYNDYTPRTVVGFSIFWTSPLGPLRFNFTDAIEKEEFDEEQTFDLTISTRF
ncbi:outer membrane protein assembly factor BamA [Shimia ponticola]|uniref:outer membrane protein assembly factor BamA n=1 Tax=Shimia ponticola TaxID=2582893 RepID=UPI0011BE04A1|nr:outer membrane protein assembly factor BamA [Shimia ponticola]